MDIQRERERDRERERERQREREREGRWDHIMNIPLSSALLAIHVNINNSSSNTCVVPISLTIQIQ